MQEQASCNEELTLAQVLALAAAFIVTSLLGGPFDPEGKQMLANFVHGVRARA